MIEWLALDSRRQREILNQAAHLTGLPAKAIEKDWWVTLVLKAIFTSTLSQNLVFKGGTSLSKAWDLISRFSEDIDLGLDREVLGFKGELSKTQIKKLREASFNFITNDLKAIIEKALLDLGVKPDQFKITAREGVDNDTDPQILIVEYNTVLERNPYISDRVLIEVGARGLREPTAEREIQSVIGATFPKQVFSGTPFKIIAVDPKRTFLEKAFLLHEEFKKPADKIRHERLSRHLYDLDMLMDTEHGEGALKDRDLYNGIVEHRSRYNQIRGIDYNEHHPSLINFIPPDTVKELWEEDYKVMRDNMIYRESKDFVALMSRMAELLQRFRDIK